MGCDHTKKCEECYRLVRARDSLERVLDVVIRREHRSTKLAFDIVEAIFPNQPVVVVVPLPADEKDPMRRVSNADSTKAV